MHNLKKRGRRSYFDFDRFPHVFAECKARGCGTILAAVLPNGSPAAMTFLVWGQGMLYYTMSTRLADASEGGGVNLLIWSAIKKAHQLGLTCDLDGIVSRGIARFFSGYGGEIRIRLVATQARPLYGALKYITTSIDPVANESAKFS